MLRIGSTHWLHEATEGSAVLLSLDLSNGVITSQFFDRNTRGYLRDTVWRVLSKIPVAEREEAAPVLLERVVAVTSLTGEAALVFGAQYGTATVTVIGLATGEELLVQIPFSGSMAMLPPTGTVQKYDHKHVTLGDASTGFYHVTVAARAVSELAIANLSITKHAGESKPGTIGTFAVEITGTEGVFIHSVTITTYTRVETQAKLVLIMDNPQGLVYAHHLVRPTATQLTVNNAQSATPVVSVAEADGALPAANGMPYQLDPEQMYSRLRVAAAGFAQAGENVVTDPAFNRAQSLVVQF